MKYGVWIVFGLIFGSSYIAGVKSDKLRQSYNQEGYCY